MYQEVGIMLNMADDIFLFQSILPGLALILPLIPTDIPLSEVSASLFVFV